MVVLEKTAKRESSLGSKQKFLYFTIPSSFTPMLTDMDLSNDMASFKQGYLIRVEQTCFCKEKSAFYHYGRTIWTCWALWKSFQLNALIFRPGVNFSRCKKALSSIYTDSFGDRTNPSESHYYHLTTVINCTLLPLFLIEFPCFPFLLFVFWASPNYFCIATHLE